MKPRLCIKVDEKLGGLDVLKNYYTGIIEIQLLTRRPKWYKFKNFGAIIFHASEEAYNLPAIVEDRYQIKVIEEQLKAIDKLKAKTQFLIHCGWDTNKDNTNRIIQFLNHIVQLYDTPILLENTITPGNYERCTDVINTLDTSKVSLCLDTSHIRAIINQGYKHIDYYKGIKNVTHVHFSYSSNGDGYKDMKTHGVNHILKREAFDDLDILQKLNVTPLTLCPEVAEKDYSYRSNQVQEIQLLKSIDII